MDEGYVRNDGKSQLKTTRCPACGCQMGWPYHSEDPKLPEDVCDHCRLWLLRLWSYLYPEEFWGQITTLQNQKR